MDVIEIDFYCICPTWNWLSYDFQDLQPWQNAKSYRLCVAQYDVLSIRQQEQARVIGRTLSISIQLTCKFSSLINIKDWQEMRPNIMWFKH